MTNQDLKNVLGNLDIYLLDQIVKGRYNQRDKILDAGCGTGRNMYWFYNNQFNIWAVDKDLYQIRLVKQIYPGLKDQYIVSEIDKLPYANEMFNHIICNAVLHFAKNEQHFYSMFGEMLRVIKVHGSIFIRMTSNIGIEDLVISEGKGMYSIPDGTQRFLMTRELLENLMERLSLTFLEPIKTTNVHDVRSMTTLVLQKN
jgi:tellurite methyltransferase